MLKIQLLLTGLLYVAAQANSSEDKFIKKYAMMMIYERCFGTDVVKQIRLEMKQAYAKCSLAPSVDSAPNTLLPSDLINKLPQGYEIYQGMQPASKPTDGDVHDQINDSPISQEPQPQPPQHPHMPQKSPPIGGVLTFRPHSGQLPHQLPLPPFPMPNPQYRPYTPANPFYQFPYSPGLFYPPGFNPYPYQQYQQNYYQPPYFGSSRMSRNLDLRDRLEIMNRGQAVTGLGAGAGAGRARNITCVMQELGYIDQNLEPNYERISQRITNLPVSAELRGDIQDGLQFCRKFSQCVPDVTPLSQELMKPMFFFRCYKHKKLEACIMKDIREHFNNDDDLDTDTDFRSLSRSSRSLRDDPLADPRFEALDEMEVYLYDFLSGGTGFDFDLYM